MIQNYSPKFGVFAEKDFYDRLSNYLIRGFPYVLQFATKCFELVKGSQLAFPLPVNSASSFIFQRHYYFPIKSPSRSIDSSTPSSRQVFAGLSIRLNSLPMHKDL